MEPPPDLKPGAGVRVRRWNSTAVFAGLTLFVLALSVPASLQYARTNGFHLFSTAFFRGIPARLAGPGRFRFVLQPLIAALLGIRSGRADARSGRPPFFSGLFCKGGVRRAMLLDGFAAVGNLVMMGILLDSIFQWVILGISHPGAALVVGPVLIVTPYSIARDLANRCSKVRNRSIAASSSRVT